MTLGLMALWLTSPLTALADPDEREAPYPGDIATAAPLAQAVTKLAKDYGGRLLEIELEREWIAGERRLIYEAKLLTEEGDILKIYLDAKTLKVLKRKGHYGRRKYRRWEKRDDMQPKKRSMGQRATRMRGKKHDDDDDHHDDD